MTAETIGQLSRIFSSESIALVGASDRQGSFGRLFLEGMASMGRQKVYPVNPGRSEILGIHAFPSISDIPGDVDLAILLTPPESVLGLVRECVRKRVRGIVVFSSGFGESGARGKQIEQEIARVAREGGSRVIGPNCVGFFNPGAGILTFPQTLMEGVPIESGTVGGFSQSGSFVDYLVWFLGRKGVRFSTVVSCGNECDLSAEDYLEYLGEDENTNTLVAYLEGVKDGRRFFEIAREVAARKPIVLWKGGSSVLGAKAAASHTGALAGSAGVWNAVFRQTGIINVTCMEEVVDCVLGFYYLPLPRGHRAAIVSGHGGAGVGTADNCLAFGLELPPLSEGTAARLREALPEVGTSVANPVDIGVASLVDPSLYGAAINIIAEDANIDMILVNTSPSRACAESIATAAECTSKPLIASVLGLPELVPETYELLIENGVPAYSDPKRAALVLSRMADYAAFRGGRPRRELSS